LGGNHYILKNNTGKGKEVLILLEGRGESDFPFGLGKERGEGISRKTQTEMGSGPKKENDFF